MVIGSLGYVINDALVRAASKEGLDVYQALFLRGLAMAAIFAVSCTKRDAHVTRQELQQPLVARVLAEVVESAFFFAAIVQIDFANAQTIQSLVPFVVTLVAASYLREHVSGRQYIAVAAGFIGVVIVEAFRRLVQVELDRVLVQSTVSAPRFAVGMLASEELARLDFAAEELLDSIATGTTPLPLTPKTASVAASLATELRLHLIEGRRETWLYHAVSESEMLGRSVTLIDKSSLAGKSNGSFCLVRFKTNLLWFLLG